MSDDRTALPHIPRATDSEPTYPLTHEIKRDGTAASPIRAPSSLTPKNLTLVYWALTNHPSLTLAEGTLVVGWRFVAIEE